MVSARRLVIAVVGPTATGKSALSEALAARLDGEIVNADSMQVYQGMDIGTAKVPSAERTVPYHCLDLVAPGEEFNASKYQKAARNSIDDILARSKQPLVCGGTGLYVRAALEEFVGEAGNEDTTEEYQGEDASAKARREERRKRLNAEAEQLGPECFHAKLAALDPKSAALIHPNNVRRVVRAFEWLEEGSSYASQVAGFDTHRDHYPTLYVGLDRPREQLYAHINARVMQMIERGLLDEVQGLLDKGYEQALTAQQAIGYKELVPVIRGEETLSQAVEQIQQATRHYAKRQKSWFRRDKRIQWLDAGLSTDELVTQTLLLLQDPASLL